MARKFSQWNLDAWNDPDFRALPAPAQHLYMLLWTSPGLSYCGVHDWRPARLVGRAAGLTEDVIRTIADCLIARHFLVVDEESEEVLIRSWIRFDGLMERTKMAVAMVNAYTEVSSPTLRGVIVHELAKIKSLAPDLMCWRNDKVAKVVEHPDVDAKGLPVPTDPFTGGFTGWFTTPIAEAHGSGNGSVYNPSTPTSYLLPTNSYLHANARRADDDVDGPASGLTPPGPDDDEDTKAADDRFEEFWNAYDKKRDRARCVKLWRAALKKRGVTADRLIAAATRYVTWERQHNENGRFVMDPARWLRNERWEDERPAADPAPTQRRRIARQCASADLHERHDWTDGPNLYGCMGRAA